MWRRESGGSLGGGHHVLQTGIALALVLTPFGAGDHMIPIHHPAPAIDQLPLLLGRHTIRIVFTDADGDLRVLAFATDRDILIGIAAIRLVASLPAGDSAPQDRRTVSLLIPFAVATDIGNPCALSIFDAIAMIFVDAFTAFGFAFAASRFAV